jgi:hypothetical protein
MYHFTTYVENLIAFRFIVPDSGGSGASTLELPIILQGERIRNTQEAAARLAVIMALPQIPN